MLSNNCCDLGTIQKVKKIIFRLFSEKLEIIVYMKLGGPLSDLSTELIVGKERSQDNFQQTFLDVVI